MAYLCSSARYAIGGLRLVPNRPQTSRPQSFAKNAGLYGERVGALHIILPNKETVGRVRSQLSVLQRSEISNPPSYGARVVSITVTDSWGLDLMLMPSRLR